MSTCKIKASAAFIMYLIWKDIYSHYIKFFKKIRKKSACRFRLTLQQFVERKLRCCSEGNWNLQEFHNLAGQTGTSCPPAFPPWHLKPWALSTGWKRCICFPSLCCFWHDQRHLQTHQDIYEYLPRIPGHLWISACVISMPVNLCQQCHSKKLFYSGNTRWL